VQHTIDNEIPASASRGLFARAARVLPGGVNSPVRAFRAVGGEPRFLVRGTGARVWDADGVEYLDCIGSWGPLILGHSHPAVVEAITDQAARGTAFGAPTELEVEMAELITRTMPSIEMVRMVNSGTEATMAAVRLARGATGRTRLVKFEGCYHGHGDSFLVKAGSGAATFGTPDSPGVPASIARDTIAVPYNDLDTLARVFDSQAGEIAAIIIEPLVGNMGVVRPAAGFLEGVRALCDRAGTILIFDEVMTGFRVARGGAQELTGVRADLTTLGKIIGGGLPVGAYGGARTLMEQVSPAGPVYQAGTMSGNPLAMAAGLAALRTIAADPGFYDRLEALGARLEERLRAAIQRREAPCRVARVGSMWTLFFSDRPVERWSDAAAADTRRFARYFQEMLRRGILIAPSQFEANFISAAHAAQDMAAVAAAADEAIGAACA
jgi:glutamate-1-semialdehyde 2,1-aminomutase